ncbi:MAG: NAD(P)H-dependent glycerol-3-phosphate dehydrogenase, partial [Actinomycetota bacterium]|nr:NAD(P)H-dependent glycerol-3-phosphate dehydrogenase [Actinomycetota bacterium]
VLGAGSWGTTVASLASENVHTTLWSRRAETAQEVDERHRNTDYLEDRELCAELEATDALEDAVATADVLALAVPSHGFRAVLESAAPHVRPWIPIVSLTKGLEQETRKRMTEVIDDVLPGHPSGLLAGPNLAKEVLDGYAAAAVISMPDQHVAQSLQEVFATTAFRIYTNTDVIGCELGGALKNVMAIAAGMAEGLGVGDNTRATVITRALSEITRLGLAMGGEPRTFAGLTGMGDLMATCMSPQSRNRTVGEKLAQGMSAEEIADDMNMVAEGIKTARVVMELASEHDVEMPIAQEVDAVVSGDRTAQEAFAGLLRLEPTSEIHGPG